MTRAKRRLPGSFLRLWVADALSSAGDGFTLIAAPLLLTTLTDNPILIAAGGCCRTGAVAAVRPAQRRASSIDPISDG